MASSAKANFPFFFFLSFFGGVGVGVGLRQGFCISPAILEFTLYTRLALNPQRSACLCLPLASPVLGSKVCDTTAWSNFLFLISHLLEVNQQGHMSIVLERFFRYERNYDPNLIQILKIQSVSRSTKKKSIIILPSNSFLPPFLSIA